jgi:hypothetical protein
MANGDRQARRPRRGSLAERRRHYCPGSKLIHWNELDRGGHFAELEQLALFTKELRD